MTLRSADLGPAIFTPDQISELLHQTERLVAIPLQHGFSSREEMVAYEKGRPRQENGRFVLSDTPGLTHEEALNERARLHGMPPLGTTITSKHGLNWQVADYGFISTPAAFARYPDNCDYLPFVWPTNISERLANFINETNHCTSKRILFLDTMPGVHPFKLGENIHYAICSSNPDESYIFLDVANAHETTFAHEIAHLWLNYVQDGGDGMRKLREEIWDNAKFIQLNLVQSFVVDLKVNDLISERGFDMSLINQDYIHGLTLLRDAIAIGYRPPTSREALLHSLSIAGAILEQKRWSDEEKQRLTVLLGFFEATTPRIYQTAQELVEIVRCHGYNNREAIRKTLDECITLAFHATGDDLDINRDLEEFKPIEGMKDKYPDELPGCPVPLKLEIGKTIARNGISSPCKVWIAPSATGMAQIVTEDAGGVKRGPLTVNYQLMPPHLLPSFTKPPQHRPYIGERIPDGRGRLPVAPNNTVHPPSYNPFNQFQPAFANGMLPDLLGRLPGQPGYNTGFPSRYAVGQSRHTPVGPPTPIENWAKRLPGDSDYSTCSPPDHSPFDQVDAMEGLGATRARRKSEQSWHHNHTERPAFPVHDVAHPNPNPFAPVLPGTDLMRPYMAGVGLAVARARLAQQMAINSGGDANAYQYAYNNPVIYVDPEGMKPTKHPGHPKKPKPECPVGYNRIWITAYGDCAGCEGHCSTCYVAFRKQCGCRLPEVGDCAIGNSRVCGPGQHVDIIKGDGSHTSCHVCDRGAATSDLDIKVPGPNTVANVDQYWATGHYCIKCSD